MKENLNKILLGIVGAIATTISVQLYNFKEAWEIDEATEEFQMFDGPEQKQETIKHVENLPVVDMMVKKQMDAEFQKQVVEELRELRVIVKETDSLTRLNVYLTNKIEDSH